MEVGVTAESNLLHRVAARIDERVNGSVQRDSENNTGAVSYDVPSAHQYLVPADFLPYPKDYFHPLTGCNPNTEEEAERLWPYRKNRRTDGLSDRSMPDGRAMLLEIQATRDSLRTFVVSKLKDGFRQVARQKNILMPGRSSHPVTLSDIRDYLIHLPYNEDNKQAVYELVHKFHRDRSWLATVIDEWLYKNKMYLLKQTKPQFNENNKRTRNSPTDRGGFSAVGRSAKSQTVGGLMIPMLKKAGWSVSLTEGQSNENKYVKYWFKPREMYYVVTRKTMDDQRNDEGPNQVSLCRNNYPFKSVLSLLMLVVVY